MIVEKFGKRWAVSPFYQEANDGGGGNEPPGAGIGNEDEVETVFVSSPEEIPEDEKGPRIDPEELQRQNEELQAKMQSLQQQADVATQLNQGISQLGETLKKGTGEPRQGQEQSQPQRAPGESEAEFAERLKKDIYDDPYKMLTEMNNRTMQPFVNQIINNNVAMSRRLISLDPQKAGNFASYAEEIDQEVSGMPPMSKLQDPMIYDKAYERVVARHMDEIIEKSVAQRMQEAEAARAQAEGNQGATSPSGGTVSGFTEQGRRAPAGGPRKVYKVLTAQEKQAAFRKGMSEDAYYNYLVRNGLK